MRQTEDGAERRDLLRRQGELVATLSTRAKEARASKDKREKKIERLRAYLGDPKNGLASMAPLPLPLNPKIATIGIAPDKTNIFKSNLLPLLLWFQIAPPPPPPSLLATDHPSSPTASASASTAITTASTSTSSSTALSSSSSLSSSAPPLPQSSAQPTEYPVIFKNGDDLRQDALVVQLFTLMDRLLLKENLDLRIIVYAVLATGPAEGMVQFVPSKTLAAICQESGSLVAYLRHHNPDEESVKTYGVKPEVLDTFVRSCGASARPHRWNARLTQH